MNQESLYFTRLAGDKTVELLTLQNSSMHAAAEGRPREALHIARSVLEGNYKLSPRVKALFLTRKARALAQSGDQSALALLPEIRDLYLHGVSDTDPAWAWWIDDRELAWHEAMVERDLGLASKAIDILSGQSWQRRPMKYGASTCTVPISCNRRLTIALGMPRSGQPGN